MDMHFFKIDLTKEAIILVLPKKAVEITMPAGAARDFLHMLLEGFKQIAPRTTLASVKDTRGESKRRLVSQAQGMVTIHVSPRSDRILFHSLHAFQSFLNDVRIAESDANLFEQGLVLTYNNGVPRVKELNGP